MKQVLSIAGYDPSNGAGITKDLEVFSALGLHGMAVPTSFVVQSPLGATAVHPVPIKACTDMLSRLGADIRFDAIKIGVLADEHHVNALADFLEHNAGIPVVLDPVMNAKNGLELLTARGLKKLTERVFPLVTCITPNIDEAEKLLHIKIRDVGAMEKAAQSLAGMGPKNVFLKGGHLPDDPVDVLFDGAQVLRYEKKRIMINLHGSGCMLSSSLAGFLARGYSMKKAVENSERLLARLFKKVMMPMETGYHYVFPAIRAAKDSEFAALPDKPRKEKKQNAILIRRTESDTAFALIRTSLKAARGIDGVE